MRKNTNNKTISAILVGISAILAISNPLTVYAEDTEGAVENNTASEGGQAGGQQSENSENSENTAPDAYDEVSSEITESTTDIGEARTATDEAAQPIVDANITADEKVTGNISDAALEEVKKEAQKVDPDTDPGKNLDDAQDRVDEAKAQVGEANAQDKAAEVFEEKVEEKAQEAAGYADDAQQSGADALKAANEAEKTMTEVVDDINNVNSLETAEAVQKKLNDLITDTENDIDEKKAEVEKYEGLYNDAVKALKEAKANYESARTEEQTDLGNAEGKAKDALTELKAAQTNVDNLKAALDNAIENLGNEAASAQAANDAYDTIGPGPRPNWNARRDTMISVVINYIIPQEKGSELTNKKESEEAVKEPGDYFWHRVSGFEMQDNNYVEIIYRDANGNPVKEYYNYDLLDKKMNGDRYNTDDLGKSYGFFAYEKEAEEIEADNYLNDYFGGEDKATDNGYNRQNWYKKGIAAKKNDYADYVRVDTEKRIIYKDGEAPEGSTLVKMSIKDLANAGYFDVFKYTQADGTVKYLVRKELDELGAKEVDGKLMIGDTEVTMVVQNQNNQYHKANMYLIATTGDAQKYADIEYITEKELSKDKYNTILNALKNSQGTDEAAAKKMKELLDKNAALNGFLSDEHISEIAAIESKYSGYIQKVADAQKAVTDANTEVTELKNAITTLKNNQASKKTLTAAVALGTNDVAKYLGIKLELAEDIDKYNNMTIDELIEVMNQKLTDAKADVAAAEQKLQGLKNQQPALAARIDELIAYYTPSQTPADDTTTTDTPAGTTVGGAVGTTSAAVDTVYTPVAQTSAPAAGTTEAVNADAATPPVQGTVLGANRALENGDKVEDKEEVKDSTPAKTATKTTATIADDETAKAAMPTLPMTPATPEEAEEGNWLWLIFIGFLTAIGLGAIFGFVSRRKEEEETVEKK